MKKIFLVTAITTSLVFYSCKKDTDQGGPNNKLSSDVLDKWMTKQLRLMRNATGILNHAFSRPIAYAGITALESIAPGLNGNIKHGREK